MIHDLEYVAAFALAVAFVLVCIVVWIAADEAPGED